MNYDPFEILNVKLGSSRTEIQLSFRKLKTQYHPDKSRGLSSSQQEEAREMFTRINQSYEVLMTKRLRRAFINGYCEGPDDDDCASYRIGWKAIKEEQIKIRQEEAQREDQQQIIEESKNQERLLESYSATDEEKKEIQEENYKYLQRRCAAEEAERQRAQTLMRQRARETKARERVMDRKASATNKDVAQVKKFVSINVDDEAEGGSDTQSDSDDDKDKGDDKKAYQDDRKDKQEDDKKSDTDIDEDNKEDDNSDFESSQPIKKRKLSEGTLKNDTKK